jgi:hypothetical protein
MALSRIGRGRSGPRLRVRSHPLDRQPQHVIRWPFLGFILEVELFTEEEWSQLHPAERPDNAVFMAGFGYVALRRAGD